MNPLKTLDAQQEKNSNKQQGVDLSWNPFEAYNLLCIAVWKYELLAAINITIYPELNINSSKGLNPSENAKCKHLKAADATKESTFTENSNERVSERETGERE